MKRLLTFIQRRLSLRLGLSILLVVAVVFLVSATFLFSMTRGYVKQASIVNATQILDNTATRIMSIMKEVETATDSAAWQVSRQLTPEDIISETRDILKNNPHFHSCSISMEPDFFKEYGRYFSIYSVREEDSIHTAQYGSDQFSYFEMDWYRKPKTQNCGCWIDPFLNENPKSDYTLEIITSYSRPLYDQSGRFVGVIAIDLLQKWLSQTVTAVAPYPHSSSIMIGRDGSYFVHPDTSKLIRQTIFSDPDPEAREDVILLGKDMIAGKSGMQHLVVDGNDAYVFYRPIGHEGWSMAIVCPESDVFEGYNQLLQKVWIVICVGLLVLLIFCYQTIRRAVIPLRMLERQARHIASQFSPSASLSQSSINLHSSSSWDRLERTTTRSDTIGQLQNSFYEMQQSLAKYVNDIQQMNKDMEQRNQELTKANELVLEANRKKTEFVQDVMHQIRTPLNIISGFTQVLTDNYHRLPDDETKQITMMMQENATKISRIATMLVSSSEVGNQDLLKKRESINCYSLCQEVAAEFRQTNPRLVKFKMDIRVPETLTICSNRQSIREILTELLDNANKFTQQGSITLECFQSSLHPSSSEKSGNVSFAVCDTGIGVAAADRERIFMQFTKVNSFTEGIGLGLSLSKKTAQMLGGDLLLDTSYRNGTRFVLTLNTFDDNENSKQ